MDNMREPAYLAVNPIIVYICMAVGQVQTQPQ